jgi:hypothetical protein
VEKLDYKKDLRELYFPPKGKFVVVDVPEMNFTMVDGEGNPNDAEGFQQAIQALYGISYTAKFMLKKREGQQEYVIPALEGLWWSPGGEALNAEAKDEWLWTLMIMQPAPVTRAVFDEALSELERKKGPVAPVRFEAFREGLCVQTTYVGPYADEGPTIAAMHDFIAENGYKLRGKHHEIYMGDPRRTDPEKLKTVIRQPVL